MLQECWQWDGALAAILLPLAPNEPGEAPGTGTGRKWS